jgi:predicted site-specific integrase-resolvase
VNDLITAREAASLLGVKPDTINKYARRGLLVPARKIHDRLWLYRRADVEALRGRNPGRPVTTGAGLRRKDRRKDAP